MVCFIFALQGLEGERCKQTLPVDEFAPRRTERAVRARIESLEVHPRSSNLAFFESWVSGPSRIQFVRCSIHSLLQIVALSDTA